MYYTTNKAFEDPVYCGLWLILWGIGYTCHTDMIHKVTGLHVTNSMYLPVKAISISNGFQWGQVCTVRW